jgi:hypothetical protein
MTRRGALRYAAQIDANHAIIRTALEVNGWKVAETNRAGGGFPDLVISKDGVNVLVEVKDGAKCPSARKLNEKQRKFHDGWKGRIVIIESVEEALALKP